MNPSNEPPHEFLCPLSLAIMVDPWMDPATGISFEREAILGWLLRGNRTCPLTRKQLRASTLVPNATLRDAILKWTGSQSNEDFSSEELLQEDESEEESFGNRLTFDSNAIPLFDMMYHHQTRRQHEPQALVPDLHNMPIRAALAAALVMPAEEAD